MDSIDERTIEIARWYVENQSNIRAAAKEFGISASTIDHDFKVRLPQLDPELNEKVLRLVERNNWNRYYKGGRSTRIKWRQIKREKRRSKKST